MSISGGIYNGLDYLPYMYHQWLTQPQRRMFLAKCNRGNVGFQSFLLMMVVVTAVVMQAARVAPQMRGRGIARVIKQLSYEILRSEYPAVTKALISMMLPNNELKNIIGLLRNRVKMAGERRQPTILNSEEVLTRFENQFNTNELFPKQLLIQNFVPFLTNRVNVELLLKSKVCWLYSESCDGKWDCQQTASASSLCTYNKYNRESPGFLSLGNSLVPVLLGDDMYVLTIDLFGNDPTVAKFHILQQLTEAIKMLPPGGSICCFCVMEENLRNEFSNFCKGIQPFHLFDYLVVIEHDL
ncbi:hypothetical protein GDO86_020627 [Hymenochirus boettgeri]|uniref:Histidine N-acetyltransferase C-terminal domain-containing protein n=1 Tax=Hymenochirus boettgeri TaxID=247094 RepID=A0A8T2IIK3_9PIPI|nr:hypothetical protein GDO86_020627 [Hymenochirus boettgeri]